MYCWNDGSRSVTCFIFLARSVLWLWKMLHSTLGCPSMGWLLLEPLIGMSHCFKICVRHGLEDNLKSMTLLVARLGCLGWRLLIQCSQYMPTGRQYNALLIFICCVCWAVKWCQTRHHRPSMGSIFRCYCNWTRLASIAGVRHASLCYIEIYVVLHEKVQKRSVATSYCYNHGHDIGFHFCAL